MGDKKLTVKKLFSGAKIGAVGCPGVYFQLIFREQKDSYSIYDCVFSDGRDSKTYTLLEKITNYKYRAVVNGRWENDQKTIRNSADYVLYE